MSDLGTRALRSGYHLLRAGLFRYGGGDPEKAHEATLRLLSWVPGGARPHVADPVTVAGVRFPNRVGVAAGLDKDGVAAHAWARFGFGFAELGTVTAHAQPGNPKPRMYRAVASRGIVNRMGFNNHGAAALARTLRDKGVARGNGALGIPVGISIGKTKATPLGAATDDYLESLRLLAPLADYVAVNVSSPNTPGLRSLQAAGELASLVSALTTEAAALSERPVPVFVKLAPDLEGSDLAETIAVLNDSAVSGLIATNTTLARDGLAPSDQGLAGEAGGLSGAPLTTRALSFVEHLASSTRLPVMGVGGIMTPADGVRMFEAGASLVQLFTGFIYEGPALISGIHDTRTRA
ncbi:dihydroorotate oxidase A [Tessaracoccus bendigoensis DSM 12906]|uniref:Dihydroorotate dehydrogenase (quinone) n=1 Tax=Tessaracoccus bendigoensis DSM 12906 TaxID=1123357 RepID=A0A1M6ISZ2_9ACTN|nr:quinone-dependent dihydroorotate dehydrogenase [Tessaracoccus bendigoensis]SHJ37538.1 dihydroorotate oxidase A [Tessaracoccus bendigoensis DSM 12906]